MVVVMAAGATYEDVQAIADLVQQAGGKAFISRGLTRTIVGLVGDVDIFASLNLRSRSGVAEVVRISAPYKLVSREHHPGWSACPVRWRPSPDPIGSARTRRRCDDLPGAGRPDSHPAAGRETYRSAPCLFREWRRE